MTLNFRKLMVIVLVMFAASMFDKLVGVFMPTYITYYQSNYEQVAIALLLSSLAYTLGSLLGGYLIYYIGKARLMRLISLIGVCGIGIIYYFKQVEALYIAFIMVGFTMSVAALIVNTTIPQLEVKNHALLMNFVHFLYGLGATVTVVISGQLLTSGWHFKQIYLINMILYSALFAVSLFVSLPEDEKESKASGQIDSRDTRLMFIFAIALGSYVIAELQATNWFINYIVVGYQMSIDRASLYMAIFLSLFTLGRLFGGFLADSIGYLKSVMISLIIAFILFLAGLVLRENGFILIALSGVFFSLGFPMIVLAIKLYFPHVLNRASGIIIAFATGTNVLANYLMGYLSERVSVTAAMYIIPIAIAVSIVMLINIQQNYQILYQGKRHGRI